MARSVSGTKNRTKIFPGGSSETTGAPAAMVSPGRAKYVGDAPCRRRANVALRQPPFGDFERGLRGAHGRLLGFDLLGAAIRRAGLRQRRFERRDLRGRRAEIGPALIERFRRHGAGAGEEFAAIEVGFGARQRGPGVGQIRLRLFDLGRLAGRLQIGELLLRLVHLPHSLIAGRAICRVVLGKQRRTRGDLIAARNIERGEQALLRGADLHEVGVRVALPLRRRRRAMAMPPPNAGADRRSDRKSDAKSKRTAHGTPLQRNDYVAL